MLAIYIFLILNVAMCQEDDIAPIESKECRERDRLVSSDKEDLYALVDALEGQTLILRCRFCNDNPTDQPKNWYKVDQLGHSHPHEVKLDMDNDMSKNRISVNHKHSLIIKNVTNDDSGFYFCVHFEDKTNPERFNYLVDIVFPEKTTHNVEKGNITEWSKYHEDFFQSINNLFRGSDGREFVYWRDVLRIGAELVTQWAPWGPCQACGRPQGDAIMRRKGACRIKLKPNAEPLRNLTADEIYLFKAPAISCRSRRLNRIFPQISNYTRIIPEFFLEDKCTAACNPDAEGVNAGWKVGKSKGFKYRKRAVVQENHHLTFVCPESTLDNKVVWKRNGRTLKRGDSSYPHVIVDTFNSLYLVEVTKADEGNYTCYVDDIRMQQLVIFVYSKSKLLTNEMVRYMIYLGFILFLCSFCYCAGLVVTCQRRHLFKTYEELRKDDPNKNSEELELLTT